MPELVNFDYFLLLRLVAAVILGGIIGLERGGSNQDAGLRTHMVVCLGAASVMVVSTCLVRQYQIDDQIMRMGAQVISGVGFLGVGSIIVDGNRVRGITTAAGLWTTACVGLVVGSGYYIMAICIVVLMIFAMFAMRPLARKMRSGTLGLQIGVENIKSVKLILEQLSEENVEVKSFKIDEENEKEYIELLLRLPRKNIEAELINKLSIVPGVRELKIL